MPTECTRAHTPTLTLTSLASPDAYAKKAAVRSRRPHGRPRSLRRAQLCLRPHHAHRGGSDGFEREAVPGMPALAKVKRKRTEAAPWSHQRTPFRKGSRTPANCRTAEEARARTMPEVAVSRNPLWGFQTATRQRKLGVPSPSSLRASPPCMLCRVRRRV